jgi:putative ABC transport system permease protein
MFHQARQSINISVKALLLNKSRSFLTMLGIIIGVASVIIIISVGAGAQSLILSQVKSLGTNLIGVMPGNSGDDAPPSSAMGIVITTLTYDDAESLKEKNKAPNIVDIVSYAKGIGTLKWGSNSYDTSLSGCTRGYLGVEGGEVLKGRFFTDEEVRSMARVVVLGSLVKKELFGDSEAIGQRIKLKNHIFEVIGVMKERGTVAFQDYDDQVLIPIKTIQKLILGINHVSSIRVKVDNTENIERAIEDVKMILRERHDIEDMSGNDDDFTVRSAAQALDMITTVTNALKFFLAAMAAISLVVGGIGIMNIMLVSVSERTREIGLRKAVGADNFNILLQFLEEAIVVTLIGGIIGIILGALVSFLISLVAVYLGYDWEFKVSIFSIILAVGVSTLIGLIFGIYPARKASKLEPVEALRYE